MYVSNKIANVVVNIKIKAARTENLQWFIVHNYKSRLCNVVRTSLITTSKNNHIFSFKSWINQFDDNFSSPLTYFFF